MKTKIENTRILQIIIIMLVGITLLFTAHQLTTKGNQIFGRLSQAYVVPAEVEHILATENNMEAGVGQLQIYFDAKIQSGDKKGESVIASQFISGLDALQPKTIEQGDRVLIRFTQYGTEEKIWVFQEYNRVIPIIVLTAVFIGLILLFGRGKGIVTICSLMLTFGCLFYFFLPSILSGANIYLSTGVSCLFIIIFTLLLINGFNFKTLAAAVGGFCGIIVAGILFGIMNKVLHLTGMISEDSTYLLMLGIDIDVKAIIFSSILIGVLGAVLDVGVSIVVALEEIYPKGKKHSFKAVVDSGINIGRDIISTMTNTLILAYIGSGLSSALLLIVYSNSFLELINREAIVVEILQALIGSIGLLFTIPLTAIVYAFGASRNTGNFIEKLKPRKKQEENPSTKTSLKKAKPFVLREKPDFLDNKKPLE